MMKKTQVQEGKTQWDEILKEYMHMQYQAASLNEHFVALTAQENSLRILRESLQSQLLSYVSQNEDPNNLKSLVQHHMEHLFKGSPTFSSMKLTLNSQEQEHLLDVEAKKMEKFSLALIYNCHETWQKIGSLLVFVGKQCGGLEEKIQQVMCENKPSSLSDPDKRKGKKEIVEGKKVDSLLLSSLTVLRDALYDLFPDRIGSITDIFSYGAEVISVRMYASAVTQKEAADYIATMPSPDSERSRFNAQVLIWLVKGGDAVVQTQAVQIFHSIRNLLLTIQETTGEKEKEIEEMAMSAEQKTTVQMEKEKLVKTAAGPPLENLPEKMVEQLTKSFDRKVKSLASYLPRGHPLEPLPSTTHTGVSHDQGSDSTEKLPTFKRVSSSELEAEERVRLT